MASLRQQQIRADLGSEVSPLSIVYRNLEELKPDPRNPRRHSKKQIEQIARSIRVFGFNVPCVVDEHLRLITGHGRLAAAKLLGMQQVPTICIAHLCESAIRAFRIADNRLTDISTWNRSALAEELQILQTANLDFDLSSTGFEIEQINLLTVELDPASAKRSEKLSEDLTNREPEITVTRPGDLWLLNNHRLFCGKAGDQRSYESLMKDGRASVVLTHLPPAANDDAELLFKIFSLLTEHSEPAALQLVITDHFFIQSLPIPQRAGVKLLDMCVAVKSRTEPGFLYQRQHDLIFVFESGKPEPSSKPQINRSNVWFYPRTRSRRSPAESRRAQVIQNELPVGLLADAIADSTARGGVVLDPFLGTGSTLIAAEQSGRVCYTIESDPFLLDRALRRWQKLTADTAVHEKCGKPFNQIGEERNGRN
jgi:DNA methylase/ParB-like nuclease domain